MLLLLLLLCSPHADLMARVCVGLSDSRTTDNEPDRGVFHRHWIRVRRHCSMLSADLSLSHITCHLVMSSDVLFLSLVVYWRMTLIDVAFCTSVRHSPVLCGNSSICQTFLPPARSVILEFDVPLDTVDIGHFGDGPPVRPLVLIFWADSVLENLEDISANVGLDTGMQRNICDSWPMISAYLGNDTRYPMGTMWITNDL